MDRAQFTEKLEEFIHQFVQSCGEINTESGGISPGVVTASGEQTADSLYVDINPHGLPADKKHMVTDVLSELISKNPTLSDGVGVLTYFIDGNVQGANLYMDTEGETLENMHDFSGKYPQLMFSAMENQLENPTMDVRVADTSCFVAEFKDPDKSGELTVTAENTAPALAAEPLKPA